MVLARYPGGNALVKGSWNTLYELLRLYSETLSVFCGLFIRIFLKLPVEVSLPHHHYEAKGAFLDTDAFVNYGIVYYTRILLGTVTSDSHAAYFTSYISSYSSVL